VIRDYDRDQHEPTTLCRAALKWDPPSLAWWRQALHTAPVTSAATMPTAKVAPLVGSNHSLLMRRQISPRVATALLGKLRSQLTTEQRNTVDA